MTLLGGTEGCVCGCSAHLVQNALNASRKRLTRGEKKKKPAKDTQDSEHKNIPNALYNVLHSKEHCEPT